MFDVFCRKDNWQWLRPRVFAGFVGIGIGMEILAVLMHQYLSAAQTPLWGFSDETLVAGTALLGFLGTILLVVGSLCLLLPMPLSRAVKMWGYTTVLCFICYKGLDLLYCLDWFSFQDLLGTAFGTDRLVMNLLLISSAISLLVTMMSALFDLYRAERLLEERNLALNHEIQERQLLAAATENAAESIQIMDASGTILYANAAFSCLMGYTKEEVQGKHWRILNSGAHDEAFWMEVEDTVRQGKVWRGNLINRKKDGDLITVDAVISAMKRKEGGITHYITVKRDVTREKMLEQQAQQSQKLEAIGTLAGGIAHDLNNVLAVIIGHGEMCMNRMEEDNPMRKSMEVIMRTANRSSKLIKQLLVFSRQGIAEPGLIDPAPLVREQIKVLRSYLPSNIVISDAVNKDSGFILAEPAELQQIIFNLCTNANHAMQPDGGTLKISMDNIVVKENLPVTAGILAPGEYVYLNVCDTGCGMDTVTMKRLFEPFYTTKEVGVGTGLGLPMVHGSMMRDRGAIKVTSAPGEGSQFDLYWPRQIYDVLKEEQKTAVPRGDGKTVLVVDDTEDFKDLVEMNLDTHGFNTVGFLDSRSALNYFCKNSKGIDIALVDYMMPDMNGSDLAKHLHEINPDLPVVLLSGYSSKVTEENAGEYGFSAAISKPVETDHLVHTLCRCLSMA